ncbi:DUF4097 family beta strand repeat-containing protein [Lactobacillus sp. ESL0684]|uniref:DUF4097 family beta strand repeat-containing protein n=1 Tax=unclassified Lactobacillus TaxID=2620435 RepID=UPI0023F815BA|nr:MULTISPECIES: DUF4097 family beta strand repeat-containing protein [unclassified Lactobacillus]WEV39733.1 DUF4097 family beta strand repeat-containing protein [Lactobacillus sp. ESL0681]WEV43733.1 DUF4097 family beta strand repeat-containing protein [Lactobacillus sp. ESL0684]
MKKFIKNSVIVIAIGLCLIVIGGVIHHHDEHAIQHSPRIAKHFKNRHIRTANIEQTSTKKPKLGAQRKRTVSTAKFDKIKLNLAATDVDIHRGDKYQVKVTDFENVTVSAKVKQGTLEISDHGPGRPFGKHGWANQGFDYALKIEVTVPTNAILSTITGKDNAGDFSLQGLQLQKLNLKTDVGDCKLSDSQLQDLNFKTDTGDFTMHQASKKVNYQLGAVDCDINFFGKQYDNKFNQKIVESNSLIKVESDCGDILIN